ncbi:histone H2A [Trichonephila clavipes]|nr:histone H2A [Trichonephila clavipes]
MEGDSGRGELVISAVSEKFKSKFVQADEKLVCYWSSGVGERELYSLRLVSKFMYCNSDCSYARNQSVLHTDIKLGYIKIYGMDSIAYGDGTMIQIMFGLTRSPKKKKKSPKKRSAPKRPALQKPLFPVDEIYTMLKKGRAIVLPQVPLYLAAVYEYLTVEIIERAGNHAISRRSNTIETRDIMAAVQTDTELNEVLGDAIKPH